MTQEQRSKTELEHLAKIWAAESLKWRNHKARISERYRRVLLREAQDKCAYYAAQLLA